MEKRYINDPGLEVPENKIVIVPATLEDKGFHEEVILPLKGQIKRDWFSSHFYYCLPLTIGNQYGFIIKSTLDFDAWWDGTDNPATIKFLNDDNGQKQKIENLFNHGIITIENYFYLKTPPGINIMTIQPPNMYIPGCVAMTGVVETDQIRRDFTFNLKITIPNYLVSVRKGDPLGAFIPIQRYSVEKFETAFVTDVFDESVYRSEMEEYNSLANERFTVDKEKPHGAGRRYFDGVHTDGSKYPDHQKRVK